MQFKNNGSSAWIAGAEHSFITQRPAGDAFTFTIISDSHLGQYGGQTADELALYQQTLENVKADNPDFHHRPRGHIRHGPLSPGNRDDGG